MSWKKYFQEVPNAQKIEKFLGQNDQGYTASKSNFQSWLPEVYSGPSNRIERYQQYEMMDRDPVISTSLDTIAEFCTQKEEKSKEYFEFNFKDEASEAEIQVLNTKLREWTENNDLDKRLWRTVRNIILYGDQFFVRDPETYKWLWIDPYNVEKVIVNEADGKKPEEYWISNPDLNLQTLSITSPSSPKQSGYPAAYATPNPKNGPSGMNRISGNVQTLSNDSLAIDAVHIVHFSLSEGLDNNWPFGTSILEPVYKTYKQKELLEDAILIYRVHRAPERRVFYIDVGNMPNNRAMAHLERVKNEINQRRIPTRTGGNQNIMDTTFNPMSLTEDYFFPQHSDGRGSRVDTLPGGENLGQINDLDYFDNKLKKGLNVPTSYITGASTEDTQSYNDGRATVALIAEYRFQKYCERLQSLINDIFDYEFKLYLKADGVNIDSSTFQLSLNTPQNFAKYRQIELDNALISTWGQISEARYISKRFAMKRWLGLTEDEIVENEKMWKEENPETVKKAGSVTDFNTSDDLRSMGIRPDSGDDFGLDDDFGGDEFGDDMGDIEGGEDSAISGNETTPEPPPPPGGE